MSDAEKLAAVEALARQAFARPTGVLHDGEPFPAIIMAVDVWHALGMPMPAPNGEAVYAS